MYIKLHLARTQSNIISSNYTYMQKQTQTLAKISTRQLERFLVELANLKAGVDAARRLRERFAAFIPGHDPEWVADLLDKPRAVGLREQIDRIPNMTVEEIGENAWVGTLKLMLGDLWTEPDYRQKEWGVFAFRYALYKWGDNSLRGDNLFKILYEPEKRFRVPPPTPFELALAHFLKAGDRARYCANPECPAPYFFVTRKNQRYCSEICAGPAQRELKRKWWAEHGEEWRAARQKKDMSKKGGSKVKSSEKPKTSARKRKEKGS
jgi:hypothetical protein